MYNGQGIADLGGALEEITYTPLLQPLRAALNPQNLRGLSKPVLQDGEYKISASLLDETMSHLLKAGRSQEKTIELEEANQRAKDLVISLSDPEKLNGRLGLSAMVTTRKAYEIFSEKLESDPRSQYVLMIWAFLSNLAGPGNKTEAQELNREIAQRKPVVNLVKQTMGQLGFSDYESWKATQAIQALIIDLQPMDAEANAKSLLEKWVSEPAVTSYLEINEYNSIRWFNKEHFENLLWYQRAARLLTLSIDQGTDPAETLEAVLRQERLFTEISDAEAGSDYQLDKLIELLDQD
jgi:hypothetical protein